MKKKETIAEQIAHRKYKPANKALWWVLKNLVIDLFLAPKYNPHYNIKDNINDEERVFACAITSSIEMKSSPL